MTNPGRVPVYVDDELLRLFYKFQTSSLGTAERELKAPIWDLQRAAMLLIQLLDKQTAKSCDDQVQELLLPTKEIRDIKKAMPGGYTIEKLPRSDDTSGRYNYLVKQ